MENRSLCYLEGIINLDNVKRLVITKTICPCIEETKYEDYIEYHIKNKGTNDIIQSYRLNDIEWVGEYGEESDVRISLWIHTDEIENGINLMKTKLKEYADDAFDRLQKIKKILKLEPIIKE